MSKCYSKDTEGSENDIARSVHGIGAEAIERGPRPSLNVSFPIDITIFGNTYSDDGGLSR
jgi:hypothetical protein